MFVQSRYHSTTYQHIRYFNITIFNYFTDEGITLHNATSPNI